jgi:hypothetical protein
MLVVPTDGLTAKAAEPDDKALVCVPVVAPVSVIVTLPVGVVVTPLGGATFTVMVTDCVASDGFSDEVRVVVAVAFDTVSVAAELFAGAKLLSPP